MEGSENIGYDLLSSESVDVTSVATTLIPQIATESLENIYKSSANKTIEGLVTSATKLKLPTTGIYCKVVPDYSMLIAMKIVLNITGNGYIECYAPSMTKTDIYKAIGVKYPKMGINEFAKFVSIDLHTIKRRIEILLAFNEITLVQAKSIFRIFQNTATGVLVIPAIEILKNLLAGMDFDGDAIQLYFDSDIIEVL